LYLDLIRQIVRTHRHGQRADAERSAFRESSGLSPMLGGLLATCVTFTPCFLWIFVGAPYIEALRGNKALAGALSAITAAVGMLVVLAASCITGVPLRAAGVRSKSRCRTSPARTPS
jgi:Chromate transporter